MNKYEQEEREYQRLISKKCADCTYCNNSRCKVHNRQVDPDFNKCIYHSDNSPNADALSAEQARKGYAQVFELEQQVKNRRKIKRGAKAA